MKKLLILIVLFFTFNTVKAQGIPLEYGARLAINMAKLSHDEGDTDLSYKLGFAIGMFATYNIQQQMFLAGELLYNRKGGKWEGSSEYDNWNSNVIIQTITMNLLFRYYFLQNFGLIIGPQFNFLLSANEDWESTSNGQTETGSDDLKDHLKSFEMGVIFGVVYQLNIGLIVDVRYALGLTNMSDQDQGEIKSQSILVGFSYPIIK